jgi:hypothetical protein
MTDTGYIRKSETPVMADEFFPPSWEKDRMGGIDSAECGVVYD